MKLQICPSGLIVLLIAIEAQFALASTKVHQGPYKSPPTNERSCRWIMNQRKGVPLIRSFVARCMYRRKHDSILFLVRNLMPSSPRCLCICLTVLRRYSCHRRLVLKGSRRFIDLCCTHCGGTLLQTKGNTHISTCYQKAVASSSPNPPAPLEMPEASGEPSMLAAVDESFSPAYNTKVLRGNTLAILLNPFFVLLNNNTTVSVIPFRSESSFIALPRGQHFSIADISATKSSVPRETLHSPRVSSSHLASAEGSDEACMQIRCHIRRCGVLIKIYAASPIRSYVI